MGVVNRTEFAEIVGFSARQVLEWMKEGMPAVGGKKGQACEIDTAAAIKWLIGRGNTRRAAPTEDTSRGRVASEQADKLALQNAKTRGELVLRDQVRAVLMEANTLLAGQLDGVAGRLANELAGISEPARIRGLILDEHRRIRSAYADALGKLGQSERGSTRKPGRTEAAAEADLDGMGGEESEAA